MSLWSLCWFLPRLYKLISTLSYLLINIFTLLYIVPEGLF